jgi:hypothetical protein
MSNHLIPFEEAIAMTSLYRQERENILEQQYREQEILAVCETFDKSTVEALLSQEGCASMRIYYGMDENMKVHSILVGVDANGDDMLPPELWTTPRGYAENRGALLEDAGRCPSNCPSASPLNS